MRSSGFLVFGNRRQVCCDLAFLRTIEANVPAQLDVI